MGEGERKGIREIWCRVMGCGKIMQGSKNNMNNKNYKTLDSFVKATLKQLGLDFSPFKTPSRMKKPLTIANGRMYLLEQMLFAKFIGLEN